jgi:hypothetical protein
MKQRWRTYTWGDLQTLDQAGQELSGLEFIPYTPTERAPT